MTNLTGIKPTGLMHIGNEYGMQITSDSIIMIADGHALTSNENINNQTIELAKILMAIAPNIPIYRQTDITDTFLLFWILSKFAKKGQMDRMHAFKAVDKNLNINIATYTYAILMTADIMISNAQSVTLGPDQKQHAELAQYLIKKLNMQPPKFVFQNTTLLGSDGRKMSKSYNNYIPAICSNKEELMLYIKRFVTNSVSLNEAKIPESMYFIAKHYLHQEETFKELYKNSSWLTIKKTFCDLLWEKIQYRYNIYKNISDENVEIHLRYSGQKIQNSNLVNLLLSKNC